MKNLKKLHVKILIAAAIIGAVLGVVLKGIQIRNAIAHPTEVAAPRSTPTPHKTIYTLTLSQEVIVEKKK
jgi:hypothetical protein